MTTQAFTQGTAFGLTYALATNSTFTGNIVGIDTAPEMSRTSVETTNSASASGWKTFIAGDIKDGGMFAVTVQYNTQLDYATLFAAGCDVLTITFPVRGTSCGAAVAGTAATWASAVIFEKVSPKWEFESQIVITLTFRCSGAPTYVAALE